MRRTGVWVSVFRNSVIHEIFSEFLQSLQDVGTQLVSPFYRGFCSYLDFLVDLDNNGSHRSFCSTCELDTDTRWESIPLKSSHARVSLSLDTVIIGEIDELEKDVGWLCSCLEGLIDVEEWELDEELDDKSGSTIGTKFSVLHCIRIPFLMKCGFWPLIHSWEHPFSSPSFLSDKTSDVFSSQEYIQF